MPYNPADPIVLAAQIKINGVWVTVTSRARSPRDARGVRIKQGRSEGAVQAESSRCWLTLGNDDGWLTPGNPTSPWWGQFGEGTPLRVLMTGVLPDDTAMFTGQIEEVDPVYPGGDSASVRIMAMGTLGILLRGADPAASPTDRWMRKVAVAPLAWWPLAAGDERATVTTPSGLAGGLPMVAEPASAGTHRLSGVVGGGAVGPPGSPRAVDLSGGGQLRATLPASSSSATWRLEMSFMFRDPVGEFDSGQLVRVTFGSSNLVGVFAGSFASTETTLQFTGSAFDSVASTTVIDDGAWHHLRLDLASAGGGANTAYELAIDGTVVLSGTSVGVTFGAPSVVVVSPTGDLDAASQVIFWSGTLPGDTDGYTVHTGHTGERQLDRVARICDEEDVSITIRGSHSQPMGPQPVADIFGILMDVETLGGMLFDDPADIALIWRAMDDLYAQTPQLDILHGTWTKDTKPLWSSRGTVNDVTVSMPGGDEVHLTDEAHVTATQRRIRGGGTFNTVDRAGLTQVGGWLLASGTVTDARYPRAGINLRNNHGAAHADAILEMEPGDRIRAAATSFPTAQNMGADQMVTGWLADIDADMWQVYPTLVPAAPYSQVGIYDTSRYGSAHSTLAAGYSATATSLSVATAAGHALWRTGTVAFDIEVEGIRIPVTDIAGSSSPQTFTVTRNADGYDKALTSGAQVRLWQVARYGL